MQITVILIIISALLVISQSAPVENDVSNVEDSKDRQKRGNLGSHTVEDIIAQATCSAYVQLNTHGWMYAVRRDCSSSAPTCDQICADKYLHVQDAQTAQRTIRTCAGAVHVYLGRPATGSGNTPKLGLKTLFEGFEKCIGGCGPNYCCCKVKY